MELHHTVCSYVCAYIILVAQYHFPTHKAVRILIHSYVATHLCMELDWDHKQCMHVYFILQTQACSYCTIMSSFNEVREV